MSKLKLDNVTLLCVDCKDVDRAVNAMEICLHYADFQDVILITNIPQKKKGYVNPARSGQTVHTCC